MSRARRTIGFSEAGRTWTRRVGEDRCGDTLQRNEHGHPRAPQDQDGPASLLPHAGGAQEVPLPGPIQRLASDADPGQLRHVLVGNQRVQSGATLRADDRRRGLRRLPQFRIARERGEGSPRARIRLSHAQRAGLREAGGVDHGAGRIRRAQQRALAARRVQAAERAVPGRAGRRGDGVHRERRSGTAGGGSQAGQRRLRRGFRPSPTGSIRSASPTCGRSRRSRPNTASWSSATAPGSSRTPGTSSATSRVRPTVPSPRSSSRS